MTTILQNVFLLDMNFDKSIINLHFFFLMSSIHAKFLKNKKLIIMSSIKILNFKFFIVYYFA